MRDAESIDPVNPEAAPGPSAPVPAGPVPPASAAPASSALPAASAIPASTGPDEVRETESVGANQRSVPSAAPAPSESVQAEQVSAVESADPVASVRTGSPEHAPEAPILARIRLEMKHPLVIRWMHWINFPVLFTMIWSGLLIYWGDSDHAYKHPHQVYRIGIGPITIFRFFPTWFWTWYHAPFQITTGLGYHFFFMWLFFFNGLIYVLYTIFSGEWRYLVPNRASFREAIEVTMHDLGLRKEHPPKRKFNGAQQIAYTSIIVMGLGSLLTGLAIYKPTQAHLLTTLLGGYEMARWLHFWLTIGYCVFFLIHVAQVARAGWNNFRSMVSGYEIVPASDAPFAATAPHHVREQARYE